MGRVTDLILIDDEAWTVDELRRALKRKHCARCHGCIHKPAVTADDIAYIRRIARIGRGGNVRYLAERYGVSTRTIHRYLAQSRGGYWKIAERVA